MIESYGGGSRVSFWEEALPPQHNLATAFLVFFPAPFCGLRVHARTTASSWAQRACVVPVQPTNPEKVSKRCKRLAQREAGAPTTMR